MGKEGRNTAVQLMVGPGQLKEFGEERIMGILDYTLDALAPKDLMLSMDPEFEDLAGRVVARCGHAGTNVSLWTMVFADRPGNLSDAPHVEDAKGNRGYGSLGAWSGIGKGDEKFLFHCPSALARDGRGIERAIGAASRLGAQGLFLDRIRYPSPANGLEFLGACACPRCREAFGRVAGGGWIDLSALLVECAASGADGAPAFIDRARPMLEFRAGMVDSLVAEYAAAARRAGLRVGLDLLSPSLAFLVGQDYRRLAAHADFIKPMLYCRAYAPAGLPLEFSLLVRGLEEAGVEAGRARAFVSGVSGIRAGRLEAAAEGKGFPVSLAGKEMLRCLSETGGSPDIYAGIELVDHEAYETRIGEKTRDAYLDSLAGHDIAVCWNILYVPKGHIDAVAAKRKEGR